MKYKKKKEYSIIDLQYLDHPKWLISDNLQAVELSKATRYDYIEVCYKRNDILSDITLIAVRPFLNVTFDVVDGKVVICQDVDGKEMFSISIEDVSEVICYEGE